MLSENQNNAQAAISMDENSYNFQKQVPNKTDNQKITYSIRGISTTDPRYKPIVDGMKMWNRSNYIEITNKISPSKAKLNNHIFIEVVNSDFKPNPTWAGQATCGNRVYFYKKTKNMSTVQMKKLSAHEVGHILGYLDEKEDGLLMSHIVMPDVDLTKKYFDGLYFRYNTTKGKDLFNPNNTAKFPFLNVCHNYGIKNIDNSQTTHWPNKEDLNQSLMPSKSITNIN